MSAYLIACEQGIAGFVLHALWQVPLLAGAAWCAVKLGRPHVRTAHVIWVGTLLLCVALPVCSTIVAGYAARQAARDAAAAHITFEPASFVGALPALQRQPAWLRLLHRHVDGRGGLQPFAFTLSPRASRWIARGYVLTVAFFTAQLLAAWRRAQVLVRRSSCDELPTSLQDALLSYCRLLRVRPPALRSSTGIAGPVLAGVLRPTLLLPADAAADMDPIEIEAVLWHELAHLQRRDPLLHAACSVLLLPVSFHPAAWWAAQRIRQTREMACDAAAAEHMDSQPAYARSLLQIAERIASERRRFSGLAFFGNGLFGAGLELLNRSGAMEERMQMLMKSRPNEVRSRRAVRAAACLSLGAAAVLAAGMLQVRPALGGERVVPQNATVTPAQQAATDAGPRLLGGEHARQQLQHARRDLLAAERQATTAEDLQKIATARRIAAAAESTLASADSSPGNVDVHVDLSKLDVQLSNLKMPDIAAIQAQMEQHREALERMRIEVDSPEWKARMEQQQKAMQKLKVELNSPEFRARIEAASRVDQAQIEASIRNAEQQQERAMEQIRSGAMQRQIDQAAQRMARNEAPTMPMTVSAADPIKVPSSVMAGNSLTKKAPVYPPEAKEKKVQGEVLLHAIISEEGRIEQLTVISSPDKLLSTSALDAVREWTYKPYLMNGQPTSVETTITVHYSLAP